MTTIGKKLAAAALALCASTLPAFAGKGGSNKAIVSAINSGSVDSIIAEVERAESLICEPCIATMIGLTEDNRLPVREVAAWWFAKRPGSLAIMVSQMKDDLVGASSVQVRNAADFVGYVRQYDALPSLRTAIKRTDLSVEARTAIVRAVGYMAHRDGNGILVTAMSDGDAGVRTAAVLAWRDVLGQKDATPVVAMLGDASAKVRAAAAIVIAAYPDATVRATLEQLVVKDADSLVRRNAAFALGKIGSKESIAALTVAAKDSSGLVRGYANAALVLLK